MADYEDTGSMTLTEQPALGGEGGGQVPIPAEPVEPVVEPKAEPEVKKPESVRDAVEAAMREQDKDAAKEPTDKEAKPDAEKPAADADKAESKEAKAEGEEKKTRDETGKFAKPEGDEERTDKRSPAEIARAKAVAEQAPARFHADAKERWVNVPAVVRRDVEVMIREHEAEVTRHREASERYEPLRQYDELTRSHGRAGLQEVLADVSRLEDTMAKNPLAAINEMLQRAGPAKADGQKISLFELASAVVQMGPQGYSQAIQQAQASQQPQEDPRLAEMEQRMLAMQAEHVNASVIEPFRADHPRYDELHDDIALFLQSGKISPSLSAPERLEVAYDMAVRVNPTSHVTTQDPAAHSTPDRVEPTPAAKSIKSAPGAVTPDMEPVRGGSIEDIIRDEARRLGVSGRR